jgi:hypothetical protein
MCFLEGTLQDCALFGRRNNRSERLCSDFGNFVSDRCLSTVSFHAQLACSQFRGLYLVALSGGLVETSRFTCCIIRSVRRTYIQYVSFRVQHRSARAAL